MEINFLSTLLVFFFTFIPLRGEDWPDWLGPRRDGTSQETNLLATFPREGPERIWEVKIGEGFSGPVLGQGKLILFHLVDQQEVVEALDPNTGKKLWKFAYDSDYQDNFGKGNGPRSTPVITGDKVLTLGPGGMLTCLKLETGEKLWSRSLTQDYKATLGYFGIGTTPLVEENLVLVNVGAKRAGIVAFDVNTGKEVYTSTGYGASYSSPVVRTLEGKRTAIFFTRSGALFLEPKTGKVLFEKAWRARYDASVNAATPLVIDDLVFFSASYETGALLLRWKDGSAQEIWSGEDRMDNHYNTCLHHQGYLYGFHGRQEAGASFRCLELKTGKVQWNQPRFGCGSMILADGNLIVLTEAGELVLAEANPQAYREKARAKIFDGTPLRAQIALANGKLYARDANRLACFRMTR